MLKKFVFTICVVFIFVQFSHAQVFVNSKQVFSSARNDTASFYLKKIEIVGNKKTKPDIILRELLFGPEQRVTINQFIAAHKRVQSLALFTRVRFDIVGDRNFSALIITVFERWYIFPIPLFYLNERSWKKISYGGQLLYYNFLGRNILLNFSAAFGYNPQFKIAYRNPWFLGKHKLYTNFILFKSKVRSKSPQHETLEDNRIGFDWLIGKRVGHFTYFGLTLNYTEISASPELGLTLSPSGKDQLPMVVLSFQYDNRDLKEYPHDGWNVQLAIKRAGNNKWLHYYQCNIDLRRYQPLTRRITLAMRAATKLSSGEIPVYDRVYFGYEERIRGRFYDLYEGENLIFGGIELRIPLLNIRYIETTPLPGFESYTSELKFGISAGIFYDTGAVWFQDQELNVEEFRSGFGAGIHFHLPYIDVFRVECGFDHRWRAQFIAEVETAF